MEILILFGVILILVSILPLGVKRLMNATITKVSWFYYLVNVSASLLFLLLLAEFFLNFSHQHLVGYKTRNFLLIGLCLLLVAHYLLTVYKSKIYQFVVQLLLVSTIFITTLVSSINLANFNEFKLYTDKNFRIEKNWELTGAHNFLPKIYKKMGIIETQYELEYDLGFQYDYFHELEKSEIKKYDIYETDSSIHVLFTFNDGIVVSTIASK